MKFFIVSALVLIVLFEFCSTRTSASTAVLYAAAAYCNPVTELIPWTCQACKRVPGVLLAKPFFHVNGKSFTLGFVTYNVRDNTIVISFRGTNGLPTEPNYNSLISILNWRTNLDFTLIDYPTNNPNITGAKVHRGFMNAYNGVKEECLKDIASRFTYIYSFKLIFVYSICLSYFSIFAPMKKFFGSLCLINNSINRSCQLYLPL